MTAPQPIPITDWLSKRLDVIYERLTVLERCVYEEEPEDPVIEHLKSHFQPCSPHCDVRGHHGDPGPQGDPGPPATTTASEAFSKLYSLCDHPRGYRFKGLPNGNDLCGLCKTELEPHAH